MTSDPSTSLCDDMDYTSKMAEDKKRWLCVPRREKKYKNIQINERLEWERLPMFIIWNKNHENKIF